MKLGYFADGPWGVQALRRILEDPAFEVAFLVVRYRSPDQALRELAAERGLPLLEFPNVNDPDVIRRLAGYACDQARPAVHSRLAKNAAHTLVAFMLLLLWLANRCSS